MGWMRGWMDELERGRAEALGSVVLETSLWIVHFVTAPEGRNSYVLSQVTLVCVAPWSLRDPKLWEAWISWETSFLTSLTWKLKTAFQGEMKVSGGYFDDNGLYFYVALSTSCL